MNRWIVIVFSGDEVHRWRATDSLGHAALISMGVTLADVDSRTSEIYDLKQRRLVIDPDDYEPERHDDKIKAADEYFAKMCDEYAAAQAQQQ